MMSIPEVECWKPFLGYEGLYEISNRGRVKRVGKGRGSKAGKIRALFKDDRGYVFVILSKANKRTTKKIAPIVAKVFIDNPQGLPEVNHKDGDKNHNYVENLEWVSRSKNMKHAFATGLHSTRGVRHPRTHLTEDDVRKIRLRHFEGATYAQIGREFEMSKGGIYCIVNRSTWKHVLL